MKDKVFLLVEQIGASDNPLGEIADLKKLLDSLEKMYIDRREAQPLNYGWKLVKP